MRFEKFEHLIGAWVPLTVALNSLNRSMGLADVYPFVLGEPVIAKLRFVHDLIARTGHAEALRVVFDPKRVSFKELLDEWFFKMHDPTTKDQQGNDRGTQYRSAIFVTSAKQRELAQQAKEQAQLSGRWKKPIVTEILDAGPFTPAEDYHQKYLEKHPGGYTCHFMRD